MALPTASTPGYQLFRGRVACRCLAKWLPVYERELQRRGLLVGELGIFQLTGGADASSGTHSQGGAFDIDPLSDEAVWVARQMGADATWRRGGMLPPHIHGVLTGCPHNGPARYQIDKVRAGFDGLVGDNPDTGPRPLSGRTWRQGIEWQRQQEDWLTMMTPDEVRKMMREEVDAGNARLLATVVDGRNETAVTLKTALGRAARLPKKLDEVRKSILDAVTSLVP